MNIILFGRSEKPVGIGLPKTFQKVWKLIFMKKLWNIFIVTWFELSFDSTHDNKTDFKPDRNDLKHLPIWITWSFNNRFKTNDLLFGIIFQDFPDFNALPGVINGPTDILILDRTKSDWPSTRSSSDWLILFHVLFNTCKSDVNSSEIRSNCAYIT